MLIARSSRFIGIVTTITPPIALEPLRNATVAIFASELVDQAVVWLQLAVELVSVVVTVANTITANSVGDSFSAATDTR